MTPEEIAEKAKKEQAALVKEIITEVESKVSTQMQDSVDENGNKVTKVVQDFKEVNEKLKKLDGNIEAINEIKESITKINEVAEKQAEFLSGLSLEDGKSTKPQADEFGDQFKKALINAGFNINKDDKGNETVSKGTAHLNSGKINGEAVEVKAAHVMGLADVTGNAIPIDYGVMGKDIIPMNTNDHITDFYTVKTTSQATLMTLLVEHNLEGDINTVAEGDAATLISIQLKSKNFTIFEAAVMATISWRENADVPELMDALRRLVPDKTKQMIDSKVLTAGGDNTNDPWGCFNAENGTVFNALEYAGLGLTTATEIDLITYMKNQCQTADYSANGVMMGDKQLIIQQMV